MRKVKQLSRDVEIICDHENNGNFYLFERRSPHILGLTQQEAKIAAEFIKENLKEDTGG